MNPDEIMAEAKKHKCFGTNRFWNQVRAKCKVSIYCKDIFDMNSQAVTHILEGKKD